MWALFLGIDCAGDSARYNEGSSNQETRNPGKWDFWDGK